MPNQESTASTDIKQCSKCKISFPRTRAYFYVHVHGYLQSECKVCVRLRSKAKYEKYKAEYKEDFPLTQEEKQCSQCKTWFPATHEYFYKAYGLKTQVLKAECRTCIILRSKNAHYKNRERNNLRAKQYGLQNRERINEKIKKWNAEHPEKVKQYGLAKRARKANAVIRDFTAEQWETIKSHFHHRCAYCGKKSSSLTQDHITPLSRGGNHTMTNIVPACRSCNSKKKDRAVPIPVQPLLL